MFSGIWSDVSSKVRMESLSSDVLFDQTIQVGKHSSPFGLCCIALAGGGRICALSFMDPDDAFSPEQMVQRIWPEATLQRSDKATAPVLGALFNENGGGFPVLVRGTDFQLRVWRALLTVPAGSFITYGALAKQIGSAGAARAVGRAVGANPVALWIPCHRVVRGDGQLGRYRWGSERKRALLLSEQADLSALA